MNENSNSQKLEKPEHISPNSFGPLEQATPRDRNNNLSESESTVDNRQQCEAESSIRDRQNIAEELYNYHHKQNLLCANRDGDLYYIECPSCHSTDVHRRTFVGCRSCHTQFQLYFEDGIRTIDIRTDLSNLSAREDAHFVEIKRPNRHSTEAHIWHPRNEKRFEELLKSHPEAKKLTLYRDLQIDGKDGHGHELYRRFAIIPLD